MIPCGACGAPSPTGECWVCRRKAARTARTWEMSALSAPKRVPLGGMPEATAHALVLRGRELARSMPACLVARQLAAAGVSPDVAVMVADVCEILERD